VGVRRKGGIAPGALILNGFPRHRRDGGKEGGEKHSKTTGRQEERAKKGRYFSLKNFYQEGESRSRLSPPFLLPSSFIVRESREEGKERGKSFTLRLNFFKVRKGKKKEGREGSA